MFVFLIIAAAEIFFQPDIEADKKIPASHFLDFELGYAGAAIAPSDGHRCPRKSAHDGLERQFHREIEMRRNQRLAAVNRLAPVSLERICGVVELDPEQEPDEQIGQPVQH